MRPRFLGGKASIVIADPINRGVNLTIALPIIQLPGDCFGTLCLAMTIEIVHKLRITDAPDEYNGHCKPFAFCLSETVEILSINPLYPPILGDIIKLGDTPKPPAGSILHLFTHRSHSELHCNSYRLFHSELVSESQRDC